MNNPERPPFIPQRAVPIAGPGVDGKAVESAQAESVPRASRREKGRKAGANAAIQSARASPPILPSKEPRRHTRVDLETVMAMLETIKPGERYALREIIHLLSQLKATECHRVLTAV